MENKEYMLEGTALELAEQEWNEVVYQEMADYLQQENIAEESAEQEKSRFVIDSDAKADWAVRKIEEEKQEYDRIKELAEEQIARIEQKLETADRRFNQSTAYLRLLLGEYFMQVPHKRTKTQETYRLLSGKLVMKAAESEAGI
ncbi:MAG: host-nuclease inhibitor Gam family protein [Eisenbergiella sp.]